MHNKQASLRDKLEVGVFVAVIGLFFLLNLVVKAPDILSSERRRPAPLPGFSVATVVSGSFMRGFGAYATDAFVFRDSFRTLKAATVFGPLMQTDKGGLYFGAAGVGEFKSSDALSLAQSAEKLRILAEAFSVWSPESRLYYSLVPDKSQYAGKYLPATPLGVVEDLLAEALGAATYIPIADCLVADSFYRSDLHWDQSKIGTVMDRLSGQMGRRHDLDRYHEKDAGIFQGGYAGQMALPIPQDRMRYLDMPGLRASYLDDSALQYEEYPVYDLESFHGIDPYDLFLCGPQAVVVLENPEAPEGELYLFRDSYGSSIGPLLAGAYRRITLIDLRYIDIRVLDQFVAFAPGADGLFLFSSQILNNPSILKIGG